VRNSAFRICDDGKLIGTARASFYLYNDESDVEAFARALRRTLDFFKVTPKAGVR